jgi:hypothetical protein
LKNLKIEKMKLFYFEKGLIVLQPYTKNRKF